MSQVLKLVAAVVNELHDLLDAIATRLGSPLDDKQLHFLVFGLFGLALFVAVDAVFQRLARWSITALSFLYSFTLLAILALSVEVQQHLTGRGAMDFSDLMAGVWGFTALAGAFILVRQVAAWLRKRHGRR